MNDTQRDKKIKSQYILLWAKKIKAIELLGGECEHCGCNDPRCLEFHHLDPKIKEGEIGNLIEKSWICVEKELDKCILLCRRCHNIEHTQIHSKDTKRRENKKIILEYANKCECENCGWGENNCALEFHHRDPNEKDFELSKIHMKINSVEDLETYIIDEINKCDVLCSNCHRIEHIDDKYKLYEQEIIEKAKNIKVSASPDHQEVVRIYEEKHLGIRQMAKIFGCNRNTIKYILQKYGVYKPKT